MRQLFYAIQPSQSGISHNHMIKSDGETVITYKVLQDYMASEINASYVEEGGAEGHLRAIERDGIITAYMVDNNGKVKCMVYQSISQYRGIRSAINHVYI